MKLGLFFTLGVSVQTWHYRGLLAREKLIYEELLEKGVVEEIYWFTYGAYDKKYQKLLKSGISIITMPWLFNSRPGKLLYSFLMPIIRRRYIRACDVLKTNQLKGSWSAVIAKTIFSKRLIARGGYLWSKFAEESGYRGVLDRFSHYAEKVCFRRADFVFVASEYQKGYVINNYKVEINKAKVIPNYIDTSIFRSIERSNKFPNKLVYVGRISPEKNIQMVISAIKGRDYELDIIGNGPLENELRRLAKREGSRVNFLGRVDNDILPKSLNRYKIFILPSLYEGMPKALIEAMACGLGCIGTDITGINDIINHMETGILIKLDDSERLVYYIDMLFSDEDRLLRLGRNASAYVRNRFDIKKIVTEENEVIKRLYNRKQ